MHVVNASTKLFDATPGLRERLAELPTLLEGWATSMKAVGVSVGVLCGDEIEVFVTGMANVATGLEVTADTVFQIGSNTKLWTATVAMTLVDEGLLDLEAPVVTYVPEFTLAHADAASVTIRHLLTHTGGFLGDFFGDETTDSIATYVAQMATLEQLHPVGEGWSYCNSGWVLLGRVIEKVTGLDYNGALRTKLLDPIGDTHTRVRFEEMIPLRTAVGHGIDPETLELTVSPYGLMPACAPAGSIPVSSPADVLRFIKLHLNGGRGQDGTQVLSPATVTLMQTEQVKTPVSTAPIHGMGLGWMLKSLEDGQRVIGHTGATPSNQVSMIEVVPDAGVAVVVLTNGGGGPQVAMEVVDHVLEELTGSTLKAPDVIWPDPTVKLDLTKYIGTFGAGGNTFTLTLDTEHEGLLMTAGASKVEPLGDEASSKAPPEPSLQATPLMALSPSLFGVPIPGVNQLVEFFGFDAEARPGYLFAGRLFPRVS